MAKLVVMTWNVQNLLSVGSVGGPTTNAEYEARSGSDGHMQPSIPTS